MSLDTNIDLTKETFYKMWKATPQSISSVKLSDSYLLLMGDKQNSITVDGNLGVIVQGKVGFTELPGSIQFAGLWKFNNLMLSTIPSTIMSPIPVLEFNMPGIGIFTSLQKILKDTVGLFNA